MGSFGFGGSGCFEGSGKGGSGINGSSISGFRGRHTPVIRSHTMPPLSSPGSEVLLSQVKFCGHPFSSLLFKQVLSAVQLFRPHG